jgi:hypothetical protein
MNYPLFADGMKRYIIPELIGIDEMMPEAKLSPHGKLFFDTAHGLYGKIIEAEIEYHTQEQLEGSIIGLTIVTEKNDPISAQFRIKYATRGLLNNVHYISAENDDLNIRLTTISDVVVLSNGQGFKGLRSSKHNRMPSLSIEAINYEF